MPNFFIFDENACSKQKIKKNKNVEIIIRNRANKGKNLVTYSDFSRQIFLSLNYQPFLQSKTKGVHVSLKYDKINSKIPKNTIKTSSIHNLKEFYKAQKRFKANFMFISPVFFTKSHPNVNPLGLIKLFKIINSADNYSNFIVLGGLNQARYKKIKKLDFNNKIKGFAGIRNFLN